MFFVGPTWYGYVPDCGSFADIIYNATKKRPKFIGKPEPDMAYLAMQSTGFPKEETVIFGDRLYTDIACGVNAGISTVFVLSGEGTLEDVENSNTKPEIRIFLRNRLVGYKVQLERILWERAEEYEEED